MDSRTAAHTLAQIAALLALSGAPPFRARAYAQASRAILDLGSDDLELLYRSGELASTRGIGNATLSVLRELIETGESSYLQRLAENTPPGLLDLLRVPGLGPAKIHLVHRELGVASLDELESAAADGRLAKLPRFGPKTAERILRGIAFARRSGKRMLQHRAAEQAELLRLQVERHPDVRSAIVAGSVRRRNEVSGDIDIVAVCAADPEAVATSLADSPGVASAERQGAFTSLCFVDGVCVDVACGPPENSGFILWRATGGAEHVRAMHAHAESRGLRITGAALTGARGRSISTPSETEFFSALGLAFIPPELREGMGEIEAAAAGELPSLVEPAHIRGILHCHTTYSDGVSAIADMADAARARGWSYLGVSDHSESAFYARGLKPDAVARQHDEIDELNTGMNGFRVLKGIEADILADGRIDYSDETLERFDYVIGSIHSRFSMSGSEMTARVLKALDDPRLTILGHPTGRLLLSRAPYPIDVDAVIEKAAETGTILELNCDPHRLDLDWRHCRQAKEKNVLIAIGPDAHSERGLDNVEMGVALARKAWLEPADVLNTRSAAEIITLARRNRAA